MQYAMSTGSDPVPPPMPETETGLSIWQSASLRCPLCAGRRREYLFVVGQSRMTRCHDCGLISRTGADGGQVAPAAEARSYALDTATDGFIRDQLAAAGVTTVLEVLVDERDPHLVDDPRLQVTRACSPEALVALAGPFDAALVNGVVEETADPVALLRRIRAMLRPGGLLWVVASGGDLAQLPSDNNKLPCHVFTAPTLLRLARVAGFRTQSCGDMTRPAEVPARDARLVAPQPFQALRGVLSAFGQRLEVPNGLVELRAVVAEVSPQPRLSIVIPVFNEARTFLDTFEKIHAARVQGVDREILIVESNSTDGSRALVESVAGRPDVRAIYEDRPRGKGHAVRGALAVATGDIILIQDADSEYDVSDYDIVLEPLLNLSATFVLGSRHLGSRTWKVRQFNDFPALSWLMNLAHQGFTALANWLYDADMRDPTTMYKVFRRECIEGVRFRRDRFDFDWELVCKLIRRGHVPFEVPINYRARSYAQGKKVRFFRDPLTWLSTIIASRFESLR